MCTNQVNYFFKLKLPLPCKTNSCWSALWHDLDSQKLSLPEIIVLVAGLCWAQILGEVCAISSDPRHRVEGEVKWSAGLHCLVGTIELWPLDPGHKQMTLEPRGHFSCVGVLSWMKTSGGGLPREGWKDHAHKNEWRPLPPKKHVFKVDYAKHVKLLVVWAVKLAISVLFLVQPVQRAARTWMRRAKSSGKKWTASTGWCRIPRGRHAIEILSNCHALTNHVQRQRGKIV